jgi:hypothetical protein
MCRLQYYYCLATNWKPWRELCGLFFVQVVNESETPTCSLHNWWWQLL